MPCPIPVEPSFSRSLKVSKMRRSGSRVSAAALCAISCNTCFLLATFRCERTASGESKSAISMAPRVILRSGFGPFRGRDGS